MAVFSVAAVVGGLAFSAVPVPGLRQDRPGARLYSARLRPQLHMQGGAWGNEPETANASLELMQIRFQNVDVPAMKTWLQNWPKGTKKDGFGMPKTMLPLGVELVGDASVRLNWKGSEDPWMQIDLDGDTVRVYRQSMLQGSFGQVSALKEREEKKICEKLKEDLQQSSFASTAAMKERELPKIEKPKEEKKAEEDGETAVAENDDETKPNTEVEEKKE